MDDPKRFQAMDESGNGNSGFPAGMTTERQGQRQQQIPCGNDTRECLALSLQAA